MTSSEQSFAHGQSRVAFLSTGPLQENAVLVWDAGSMEGFLFDPGDEAGRLLAWIQALGVRVRAILLTHAHFDHIGAVQPLREVLKVPVYLHERDMPLYQAGAQSAERWNLPFVQPAAPDFLIVQDQVFTVGELRLTARELPGHAPGHVIFVGEGFSVVGDTLFRGGIGRTDLPGGSHPQLISGIEQELLTLPDNTALYPGHGEQTTVSEEKQSNPFLR